MLNSPTGTPLAASSGANPAAGYTTEEVPTYRQKTTSFTMYVCIHQLRKAMLECTVQVPLIQNSS